MLTRYCLKAIKSGYAGSFSTISTFAAPTILLGLLLLFRFSLRFVGRQRHQLRLGRRVNSRRVKTKTKNATGTHGGHTTTTAEATGRGGRTTSSSGDTVPVRPQHGVLVAVMQSNHPNTPVEE